MEYEQVTDILKQKLVSKKGMLTVKELSKLTDVNRWTLADILNGRRKQIKKITYIKLLNFTKEV